MRAVLIEAFSSRACAGNGATVVRLNSPAGTGWMQALALSLRQSETAFVVPQGATWALRWFTPRCEVKLCGHATLAATIALGHWGDLAEGEAVRFQTRSGPLEGVLHRRPGSEAGAEASISLPAGSLRPEPPPAALRSLLRVELGCDLEDFLVSDLGYGVVLLPPSAPLQRLRPIAKDLPDPWRQGLVLTQSLEPHEQRDAKGADRRADYQLRFFAPGLGIDEDPVTGSAHALVAPLWMERLGKQRICGWQCSDRPGGMVCEAADSGMIRLTGSGHLLWDGRLVAPDGPSASASPGALDAASTTLERSSGIKALADPSAVAMESDPSWWGFGT